MAGVAGHGFSPDPAVARIDRHAVDAVRGVGRTPERDVFRAHMAIEAARVGQHRVDAVPGGQPVLGRDLSGLRQRGEVEAVLALRQRTRSNRQTGGNDQGQVHGVVHAKSTDRLNGISRRRSPVAAKMASAKAGAAGAVAGSPRPRTRSARPSSRV